jgi:predicted nucleic acid-binding protein
MIDIKAYISSSPFLCHYRNIRYKKFLVQVSQHVIDDKVPSISSMEKLTKISHQSITQMIRKMKENGCWPYRVATPELEKQFKEKLISNEKLKDIEIRLLAAKMAKQEKFNNHKCGERIMDDDLESQIEKAKKVYYDAKMENKNRKLTVQK